MKHLVTRYVKDESGATAIEYGLIAALISVVIIGVLSTIGTRLNTKFTAIADQLVIAPDMGRDGGHFALKIGFDIEDQRTRVLLHQLQ